MADTRISSDKAKDRRILPIKRNIKSKDYEAAGEKALAVYDTLTLLAELMDPHPDGLELSIGAREGLCHLLTSCTEDLKEPMDALMEAMEEAAKREGQAHG